MFTYIDTEEALIKAAQQWEQESDLAVDLECENNLHHYGAYISLIQISSAEENWIVDVLKLKKIMPLIEIMENNKVQKIFHDVGFDFRILYDEFSCRPKNIFDTQMVTLLLGQENIGLGYLLKKYLNVEKKAKFQMADWIKRPLTMEMLSYAVNDTLYLIPLRNILKKELEEKGRLSWAEEEFAAIENAEFTYNEQTFYDMKGIRWWSPQDLGVLKKLFQVRDMLARKVDRPAHFIFSNKHLKEFSLRPPSWENLHAVHPIVRRSAGLLNEAVREGRKKPIVILSTGKRRHYTVAEKEIFEKLYLFQKKAAERAGIKPHLIMNKEQMITSAYNHNLSCLKKWQRTLLEEEGLKI